MEYFIKNENEKKQIVATKPCSREYSQKLIERFEGSTKLKAYIQITEILEIRSKGCIMIRIKPTINILQCHSNDPKMFFFIGKDKLTKK